MSEGMESPRPDDLKGLRINVTPTELVLAVSAPPVSGTLTQRSNSHDASLKVIATFPNGETRDVTAWASFDVREKAIAEVSKAGVVSPLRPGKTAIQVRYQGQVSAVNVSVPFGPSINFEFAPQNFIDEFAEIEWRRIHVAPSPVTNDSTFLRRVYLDLIGTLPTVEETKAFLSDPSTGKRSRIIDELLERPEYVDYWSLRWGDLLRAHRRFLGDKGLASFVSWIRKSVRDNKHLNTMTYELLTSQGNLFTNGPVAYYFIDEKVEELAETTSQVFLGVRLQCTRCHHHPNEVWSQSDYYGLAAFFSRLETKDSGTSGSRFGGPKSITLASQDNPNRKPLLPHPARLFGHDVQINSTTDPRQTLANWITSPDNAYFARNFVNRYWAAIMGRGLVEPVDDLRATNPASMPVLFDALARDFAAHDFDVKHLLRTICNSRLYQLDSELEPRHDVDGQLFTHRTPRQLSAEILLDAINQVSGTSERFVGQPVGTRAISLPDPTTVSHFLNTFGRPLRNSACECARGSTPDLSQVLHLSNSPAIHEKLTASTGRIAKYLKSGIPDEQLLDELYLATLTRHPLDSEKIAVQELLSGGTPREEVWQDVLWALINCPEFVFQH